jgi:hypothetical protein
MWGYGAFFARPIPPHLETTTGNPKDPTFSYLKAEIQPICARNDGTTQGNKDNQQYKAAAAAKAGWPATKAEAVLQPIEDLVEDKEFE